MKRWMVGLMMSAVVATGLGGLGVAPAGATESTPTARNAAVASPSAQPMKHKGDDDHDRDRDRDRCCGLLCFLFCCR